MNPTNETSPADKRRNIKLTIAYDGTDFSGWQRQEKKHKTVQGEIEKALEKIHKHPVTLFGSGRTDSGVHAAAQTANFYSSIKNIEVKNFVPALNCILSRDIRILKAEEAKDEFNARFDARSRTYRYYFITGRSAFPWEHRYAHQLWHKPDIVKLNAMAALLRGNFDCTIFASPGEKSVSRSRFIFASSFFIEGDKLVYEITANAFLWKMVRFAAGTLVRLEEEGITPIEFAQIIKAGDRHQAGPTAPPNGLFLWKVNY